VIATQPPHPALSSLPLVPLCGTPKGGHLFEVRDGLLSFLELLQVIEVFSCSRTKEKADLRRKDKGDFLHK